MNNYKSFSELKEELGNNYDFKLYEMGISALKEIENLQQENQELKEQLLVAQTNEETFRLEMEDITRALGLNEDTLFDDVKVYARSLKYNWNKLKEYIDYWIIFYNETIEDGWINLEHEKEDLLNRQIREEYKFLLCKMETLEQGSDSNE